MLKRLIFSSLFLHISSIEYCFAQFKNSYIFEGRSGIVNLFEWTFNDISDECHFLGEKGYGAVQVSPVQESKVDSNYSWLLRYQPISYKINSRSGNQDEFQNMIKKCLEHKIRIYVDVVINHMASGDAEIKGTANSVADPPLLIYPAVPYGADDFNEFCIVENKTNAFEIRNCRLVGLPDLNQAKENVKHKITEFLNELISFGVAGFRIDAVKYMWPNDLSNIYSQLKNLNVDFSIPEDSSPFIYQEVIDLGGDAISKMEYSGLATVTEFLHSRDIGLTFRGRKPLHELLQWGPLKGFLSPRDAIVFVDNQDIQRENGDEILTFSDKKQYIMANAFMLSHNYGLPRIMSSYEFENVDQGPPTDENHNIQGRILDKNKQCLQPWVCEHRWPTITEMIMFRNVVGKSSITNWADNGQNQMAFCRGNLGFIAFNNEISLNFKATLKTCVPEGVYCDIISGGKSKVDGKCIGDKIIVDTVGKAEIVIPYKKDVPVVAFHIESKL